MNVLLVIKHNWAMVGSVYRSRCSSLALKIKSRAILKDQRISIFGNLTDQQDIMMDIVQDTNHDSGCFKLTYTFDTANSIWEVLPACAKQLLHKSIYQVASLSCNCGKTGLLEKQV